MNLSSPSTIISLSPILEMNFNEAIIIPGADETIKIHPNFFFISCQNEIDLLGRNSIPQCIQKRLRTFYYHQLKH